MEVYYRDPLDLIREIYGTPGFCNKMQFAPERHWVDEKRKKRVYNEMNTGDWWWSRQVSELVPTSRPLINTDHFNT